MVLWSSLCRLSWNKWAILLGGISLLLGLVMALWSAQKNARVLGKLRAGQIMLSDEDDSPEQHAKNAALATADRLFWLGLVLTGLGVVLQTVGSVY